MPVVVVSNSPIRVPATPLISRKILTDAFDAADDWIVEYTAPRTVVITGDLLLADRCLKSGAVAIAPDGKPFTDASIGNAVAVRVIMADLRASAGLTGAPALFQCRPVTLFVELGSGPRQIPPSGHSAAIPSLKRGDALADGPMQHARTFQGVKDDQTTAGDR